MSAITVSVPGKIFLMGEHAVVYGKPALYAAVDKRCKVTLTPRDGKKVEIIAENLNKTLVLPISDILDRTYHAQKKWEEFQEKKDITLLKEITSDPLNYLAIAVGETLLYYGQPIQKGFTLSISSDIPIGSGLGSSAAIAVTIASAITLFLEQAIDKSTIHDISVLIEQKKHGNPSGGDPATVSHGNLLWYRKESDLLKVMHPVSFPVMDPIASNFYLVDTGTPVESTGEMVHHVRSLRDTKLAYAEAIFIELEKLTRDMVIVLKNNHEEDLISVIRQGEKQLENLGVVSQHVRKIIRAIEESGGAAKISGGGGRTKGTGTLVVYHADKSKLEKTLREFDLTPLPVRLGAPGLTVH